ncbi:hypothetical protein [Absidia glauca]|uniref:Uncharacterized protein n=1 Tax=Absidia glauca TaxID=4829 RepID=A0A163KRN3_ABSGL|nr:hypothetical protein [Absidia glauca]
MMWINDAPKLRSNVSGSTKHTYAKGTRATKNSGTPTTQKQHMKKAKKQQQHQQQQQQHQRLPTVKCQPGISCKQSLSLPTDKDTMDQEQHVDKNDWINVGDKKKKDANTDTMESVQQQPIAYDDGNCLEALKHHPIDNIDNITEKMELAHGAGDSDDDDKTVVEGMELLKSPTTSDDETELDSPALSNTSGPNNSTTTTHHHHYFHHHHFHCHDHHQLEPVIRNWYSPFSTGLDIDILPPRYDPLTLLDPMQLRKQDSHETHNSTLAHSSHYTNQHLYNNFSLLQNHPFISHPPSNHLQSHHPQQSAIMALPLGAIGQHSPSSSPVQTSQQRTYSLFT